MHQLVIKRFQHCLMHGVTMKFDKTYFYQHINDKPNIHLQMKDTSVGYATLWQATLVWKFCIHLKNLMYHSFIRYFVSVYSFTFTDLSTFMWKEMVCVCVYVHVYIYKHTYYNREGVGEFCDIFPYKFFRWNCGFLHTFLFLTCGRVLKIWSLCTQFCFELDADKKAFCKIMC